MHKPVTIFGRNGFILCTTIDLAIMKYVSLICSHINKKVVLFFICLFFIATIATAQTETSTSTILPSENSEQFVALEPEEVTEQTKLSGAKQTRIINLCANISNRFDATVSRLENITNRLEARMQIMNTQGFQVGAASLQLLEVRTTLNQARLQLGNIDSAVISVASGDKPRALWLPVRKTFLETHQTITLAQEQLAITLRILKESTVPKSPEEKRATTTDESSI